MEKLSPARRFWLLLKPDKFEIRNLYFYAIIIGLLNLVLPIGVQSIINLIQGGAVNTSWIVLIILVASAIGLSGILQVKQLRIMENLQQKIFTRAAFDFTFRIPRIKLEQLFKEYAPELMNRFFDVISIQKGMTKILVEFSSASIQVFFGLVLLSLYHPFFIVFSILLVALIFFIFWLTMNRGLKTSLAESKHKYYLAHWLEEVARSNTTFKLSGESNITMGRTNKHVLDYTDAREKHFTILKWQYGMMIGFKVLVVVGLLLIGGLLVIDQQMNIGQFVASEIVILLIVSSVEKVILSFETIYDVLTSLEKLGHVTDLELEKDGTINIEHTDEGIKLDVQNVSYKYPQEKKYALTDINFEVKPKEHILITGCNDSGKSTLLHVISGLLTPTNGSITIEDIPIRNYNFNQLRGQIGGYMRDETLFEGSLMDNITLGRENATFENVKWAVDGVGLTEFVRNQKKGYDTKIFPSGRQFSKSTVAKILMARAIVDRPRLLLLENSFNMFSPSDKDKILRFLLDRKHPWTLLISSTNPIGFSELIDHEIVMNEGKIIEKK